MLDSLRNATAHTFTVVEKWLELGYMPPKATSLLERAKREMGRRIKKIGASWKEKGVLAVARVLLYDSGTLLNVFMDSG